MNNVTVIYFVRHAEPNHSWEDDRSRPLSKDGEKDAEGIIEFFKEKRIDALISSPYKRSHTTILPTANYFRKEIELDERLKERKAGKDSNNHELFHRRWENKNFAEEGGESISSVQARNICVLEDVLKNMKGKTIIIGTHGTALSSIINYYQPQFCCKDFLRIINYMPYIIRMNFCGRELVEMKEELLIEKQYRKD